MRWAVLLATAVPVAWGQDGYTLTDDERLSLQRLALARARTQLYQQLVAQPISHDRTFGDWVAFDTSRDLALRGWARSRQSHGPARYYSDGTCDVEVVATAAELAAALSTWAAQPAFDSASPTPSAADVIAAVRTWPDVWACGSAALPAPPTADAPDGWEDVSPEGVRLARAAAAADAMHALLDEAGRQKATAGRRLGEFIESSPGLRSAILDRLRDLARIQVTTGPDQVAVAVAHIGRTELIRILADAHPSLYHGDSLRVQDLHEMALAEGAGEIIATGLAAPPNSLRLGWADRLDPDAPQWASQWLRVQGRYEPRPGEEFPPEMRIDLARADALDRLHREVGALTLPRGRSVDELLAGNRALLDDLTESVRTARDVAPVATTPEGGFEIRLELPLTRVWKVVRRATNPSESDLRPLPPASLRSEIEP